MKKNLWTSLLLLLALPACSQEQPAGSSSPAYDLMLRALYQHSVPLVQPAALAATLRQHPDSVTLLDTRTPAEYRVSHLRGARFVDFDSVQTNDFAGLPRHRPVVVYCSVGYRSEKAGERLKQLGFTDVRNLYGGIFEWVNEGHTIYNAQGPTLDVHPYSAAWGVWLKRGNKTYN